MPHLLMSNDEPYTAAALAGSSPADSNPTESSPTVLQFRPLTHAARRVVRPRQIRAAEPDLEPLRRQSTSIIDEVLAGTNPDEEHAREQLRWHVANNPGQPEKALLAHLLSVGVRQDESA